MAFLAFVPLLLLSGCVSSQQAQGRRAMDEGAYETAARHFRLAAAEAPTEPERWLELGRAEMAADRPRSAREAFARLAALEPGDPTPRILIGFTWEMQRRYPEALIAYEQAREVAPDAARPHRVFGTRLLRWGEPERAIEPLERAVELDPSHAETWNALGVAHYHSGDLAAAERAFRRGASTHPEHRGLKLGLAALLVNAARHAEALAVYDEVVGQWSEFAPAHVGRAILLHELGRRDEAEAAFVRAAEVARDPRSYRARLAEYRRLRAREESPE